MVQQKSETREYRGEEIFLMNINWNVHLDQAWQCNWLPKITYGKSADEAFEKMKKIIDNVLE